MRQPLLYALPKTLPNSHSSLNAEAHACNRHPANQTEQYGLYARFNQLYYICIQTYCRHATVIINFPASESPFEKVAANASSNITGKSQVFIMAATRKNITNHGNTLTKLNPLPLSAYLFFINYNTPIGVLRLTA